MDEIMILGLELSVQIGVPEMERAGWQTLRADIVLRPRNRFDQMADDIAQTIDYQALANELKKLAAARPRCLIETLAGEMTDLVLQQFNAQSVQVELRKRVLPGTEAVAVRMTRVAKPIEERLVV